MLDYHARRDEVKLFVGEELVQGELLPVVNERIL